MTAIDGGAAASRAFTCATRPWSRADVAMRSKCSTASLTTTCVSQSDRPEPDRPGEMRRRPSLATKRSSSAREVVVARDRRQMPTPLACAGSTGRASWRGCRPWLPPPDAYPAASESLCGSRGSSRGGARLYEAVSQRSRSDSGGTFCGTGNPCCFASSSTQFQVRPSAIRSGRVRYTGSVTAVRKYASRCTRPMARASSASGRPWALRSRLARRRSTGTSSTLAAGTLAKIASAFAESRTANRAAKAKRIVHLDNRGPRPVRSSDESICHQTISRRVDCG